MNLSENVLHSIRRCNFKESSSEINDKVKLSTLEEVIREDFNMELSSEYEDDFWSGNVINLGTTEINVKDRLLYVLSPKIEVKGEFVYNKREDRIEFTYYYSFQGRNIEETVKFYVTHNPSERTYL